MSHYTAPPIDRIPLDVPFHQKDKVKPLGARWDQVCRTWWITVKDAEANPGVYRFVLNPSLRRRLKEAHDFQTRSGGASARQRTQAHPWTAIVGQRQHGSTRDA